MFLEGHEGFRVAEKTGYPDEHVPKQGLHLSRGLLQELDVAIQAFNLMDGHAPFNAALHTAWLVLAEIVAGLGPKKDKYLFLRILCLGRWSIAWMVGLAQGLGCVRHDLARHLSRGELKVHQTGRQGAAGHSVIFGCGWILDHDHASLALDGPHAQRAVAAGAGKHNPDGPLMLILGQGAEEKVNGHPLTSGS